VQDFNKARFNCARLVLLKAPCVTLQQQCRIVCHAGPRYAAPLMQAANCTTHAALAALQATEYGPGPLLGSVVSLFRALSACSTEHTSAISASGMQVLGGSQDVQCMWTRRRGPQHGVGATVSPTTANTPLV
jgi:hypothetical protein